jgi:hypothetical protein
MTSSMSDMGYGYQPLAAPPRKLRPGRIWYLASITVFAVAAALLVFGVFSFVHQVNTFQRVPLPAGGSVSLPHSGGYVFYYEGQGAQSGQFPNFNVRVDPASPGAAVAGLKTYHASVRYSFGSHEGRAVLVLQVTHPGRFTITVSGAQALAGADLAVGPSIAGGIVRIVLPSVPLMVLSFFGGLAVFIIRIVRKSGLRAGALA